MIGICAFLHDFWCVNLCVRANGCECVFAYLWCWFNALTAYAPSDPADAVGSKMVGLRVAFPLGIWRFLTTLCDSFGNINFDQIFISLPSQRWWSMRWPIRSSHAQRASWCRPRHTTCSMIRTAQAVLKDIRCNFGDKKDWYLVVCMKILWERIFFIGGF